jgi:hypothetical protein
MIFAALSICVSVLPVAYQRTCAASPSIWSHTKRRAVLPDQPFKDLVDG